MTIYWQELNINMQCWMMTISSPAVPHCLAAIAVWAQLPAIRIQLDRLWSQAARPWDQLIQFKLASRRMLAVRAVAKLLRTRRTSLVPHSGEHLMLTPWV